jgi:steroid delta-isomerase-like uncharacterized protein
VEPAEKLVRDLLDAWNAADSDGIAAAYSPDMSWNSPWSEEPLRGRELFMEIEKQMLAAFSDIHWEAPTLVASGNTAAYEFVATSTHTGPLSLGDAVVQPSGKQVTMKGAVFALINDQGQIYEEHRYFDVNALRSQLGLPPK